MNVVETDFGTSIGGTSNNMDAGTIKAEAQVNAAADSGPGIMRISPAARM